MEVPVRASNRLTYVSGCQVWPRKAQPFMLFALVPPLPTALRTPVSGLLRPCSSTRPAANCPPPSMASQSINLSPTMFIRSGDLEGKPGQRTRSPNAFGGHSATSQTSATPSLLSATPPCPASWLSVLLLRSGDVEQNHGPGHHPPAPPRYTRDQSDHHPRSAKR